MINEEMGRDSSSKKAEDAVLARVFQALRISVNQEFEALDDLLEALPHALSPGGRVVILTFHSGEDRYSRWKITTNLPTSYFCLNT